MTPRAVDSSSSSHPPSSPVGAPTPTSEDLGPPGQYICRTCGFVAMKMLLRASDMAVGVDARPVVEACPNDGQPLQPKTWKEDALDSDRVGREQMRRADALQDRLLAIQQVAAVHTGVLSNQIHRLCEDALHGDLSALGGSSGRRADEPPEMHDDEKN